MIDYHPFYATLRDQLKPETAAGLIDATEQALANLDHGDFDRWQAAIEQLPEFQPSSFNLSTARITVGEAGDIDDETRQTLKSRLMELHPWRKGPFEIGGLHIDTEWRSDMKWARLEKHLRPLKGRRILDIGCGNGYYLMRMLGQEPAAAAGIDPFWLYVMQFQAVNRYIQTHKAGVLPLSVEAVMGLEAGFDTVFSMGVLYHRKEPQEHLETLVRLLTADGELVLETLVVDEKYGEVLRPEGRYAKMRNVWAIPSPATAIRWLEEAGLTEVRLVDLSVTTLEEQRKTEWMRFESLEDYLAPDDAGKTIEGYPAPVRGVFIGRKP